MVEKHLNLRKKLTTTSLFDLNTFWLFKVKKLAKFELEKNDYGLTKSELKNKFMYCVRQPLTASRRQRAEMH